MTIVVSDDYVTIQKAINNVIEGDTVFVKSGTYTNQGPKMDKSLPLIGEDVENTILAVKELPGNSIIIRVEADDAKISV